MKKIIIILILLTSSEIFGQILKTGNSQIVANVDEQRGFVTVLLPPGNIGQDPQLCFQDKCFFTCQIGSTIFTNNDIVTLPANGKILSGATTIKIADTIRTTWLDKNGCDIIQDIYPVLISDDDLNHHGSGQIVYKWKIFNHSGAAVSVPSQYLQDVQITETRANHGGNQSNDGPTILTKWQYTDKWVQYPNSTFTSMPWFYIGFVKRLGSNASLDPGLSAMGYLDYGAPLFLTKPLRMTNGDWYDMARYIFGASPSWNVNGSTSAGNDNAILLEFPAVSVPSGKTIEIARTSYGTGEYEKCIGQLFSLVFYPHHLVWTKDIPVPPGSYAPNPVHIEKFIVVPLPPQNTNASSNTKITLTVGSHLTIVDSTCSKPIGKTQTKPDTGNGKFLAPGGVGYFDWWVCADPEYGCAGPVYESLKFTGACGFCPPAFVNDQGADECDQQIMIDCAETDKDAPQFSDTLVARDSASINVRDWRTTDMGLKSIIWTPASGTNPAKFIVKGPIPSLLPCYNDNMSHLVTIVQLDSTIGGCYYFTSEDCIGHQSFDTVCLVAHPKQMDFIPPTYTNNAIIDSLKRKIDVHDWQTNDLGLKSITWYPMPGTDTMKFNISFTPAIRPCNSDKDAHTISFVQLDSLIGGCYSFIFEDCAGNKSFDTLCMSSHQFVGVHDGGLFHLSLEANHPNPFSHITTFSYIIAEYGMVKLYLYDELGKELSRIVEKPQAEGRYTIDFDGSKLPSGSYIVRLESGGRVVSRKVIIDR